MLSRREYQIVPGIKEEAFKQLVYLLKWSLEAFYA